MLDLYKVYRIVGTDMGNDTLNLNLNLNLSKTSLVLSRFHRRKKYK